MQKIQVLHTVVLQCSTHQEAWRESSRLPCNAPCTTCPAAPRGIARQKTCAMLIIGCPMQLLANHCRMATIYNIFVKMTKHAWNVTPNQHETMASGHVAYGKCSFWLTAHALFVNLAKMTKKWRCRTESAPK